MASDEQFSLCWNNFHANMSAGFHGLLSRGDLVDVTLAAEGRLLQAHKLVLSVCSPYFQEMFKMNPTQHPIVFLKDVSHSALRDLLQFMYQGEVNVKQEELATFISTAEQLQVKGLTGNQNEESSTPSKPKPTSRPGPRSSQQRQSVMTKLETDLETKTTTPVAIKRTNRPSIASNNSSSSQSGPAKRKCIDPLEAGPSGSTKDEFVTIPDEEDNNAVAPKMEPEFVNESLWDEDEDGTNNDETNFGEDDSNMDMSGFDGSATGDGTISAGGEGGAVGDAQELFHDIGALLHVSCTEYLPSKKQLPSLLESVEHLEDENIASVQLGEPQKVVRRRKREPTKWKKVIRKENRVKGKQYINTKGNVVRQKEMDEHQPCSCVAKCHKKISPAQQRELFQKFYDLGTFDAQTSYLFSLVHVAPKFRTSISQMDSSISRRFNTRVYQVENSDGGTTKVCKEFFKKIFQVSDGRITRLLRNKLSVSTPPQDQRGRRTPKKKTNNE